MVWMSDKTEEKYPYVKRYYKELFPSVGNKASIFRPWMKYGVLDDDDLGRRALSFVRGKGPEIQFDSPGKPGCDFSGATNLGGTKEQVKEGQKNKLLVGMTWATTVSVNLTIIADELGELANASLMHMFDDEKTFTEGHRKVVRLLEATTLHELIHWSYYLKYKSKGPDEEEKRWNGDAEGGTALFEREAYGQSVGFDWHAVCKETLVEANFGWVINYVSPGPVVDDLMNYGVASNAGIQKGDIIVAIEGETLITPELMASIKKKTKPGTSVTVQIQRKNVLTSKADTLFFNLTIPIDKQSDARKRAGID